MVMNDLAGIYVGALFISEITETEGAAFPHLLQPPHFPWVQAEVYAKIEPPIQRKSLHDLYLLQVLGAFASNTILEDSPEVHRAKRRINVENS